MTEQQLVNNAKILNSKKIKKAFLLKEFISKKSFLIEKKSISTPIKQLNVSLWSKRTFVLVGFFVFLVALFY